VAIRAIPSQRNYERPARSGTSFRELTTGAQDEPLTFDRFWRRLLAIALNLGLLMILFQSYKLVRRSFIQRGEIIGFAHADQIIRWEKNLHLFFEPNLQRWILNRPEWVIEFLNYYYVGFMPLFYTCCALGLLLGPVQFRFWRRVFLSSMLLALPWYFIYPLAPPRFMTEFGFLDTLKAYGHTYSSSNGLVAANQFAAMPSMHIGWSTIGALMLATCLPRIKGFPIGAVIGVFHVSMMTLTVMATANHYFLDEVGGWIIVGAALLVAWKVIDRIPFGFPRWLSPT
jgi:PAP2 superfamily